MVQLKNKVGKAEALKQAQAQTRTQYPHPYYWSAFILTGYERPMY